MSAQGISGVLDARPSCAAQNVEFRSYRTPRVSKGLSLAQAPTFMSPTPLPVSAAAAVLKRCDRGIKPIHLEIQKPPSLNSACASKFRAAISFSRCCRIHAVPRLTLPRRVSVCRCQCVTSRFDGVADRHKDSVRFQEAAPGAKVREFLSHAPDQPLTSVLQRC
jgi:hypothetical protein